MKSIKILSVMLCTLAIVAFTSCNSESGETWTPLTPTEKASCFNLVQGTHNGKMIYLSDEHKNNSQDYQDTTSVTWNIGSGYGTDTLMTVRNFPVKIFSKYIKDEEISKALANQEQPIELTSSIYFYQTSPVAFLINPLPASCTLNYGGADHKVTFYFYQSSVYSPTCVGMYSTSTSLGGTYMLMQMYVGGYKVDAKDSDTTSPTQMSYRVNSIDYTMLPLGFISQK